jgi:hypothetical protein
MNKEDKKTNITKQMTTNTTNTMNNTQSSSNSSFIYKSKPNSYANVFPYPKA